MKKLISVFLLTAFIALLLIGCKAGGDADFEDNNNDGKLNVVTTIFPPYDFVRQIAGDKVNLSMLLAPGEEVHSFEPSPQDIINLQSCDMFIYVGGESDAWVDEMIDSFDSADMKVIALTDIVEPVIEQLTEGMEEQSDDDSVEYDEHMWTSLDNSIKFVNEISKALCLIDEKNAGEYEKNTAEYVEKLSALDEEIAKTVENGKRKTIVFGDRFPMRYFADEYGLKCCAAFSGCSAETEPSAATVAFLIDYVKTNGIPVVFYTEFSNQKIADTICDATGAKKLMMHSCHNLTKEDFEGGITLLDLMQKNAENLKEALN